jgi:uncharacterized protein YidB (DUF937 family)
MGLLDNILNEVVKSSGYGNSNTVSSLAKVLLSSGGSSTATNEGNNTTLDLIMHAMKNKGLQDKLSSWIGTGSNQPITENEVQTILGDEMIGNLSKQTNLNTNELVKQLTVLLPVVIDQLTPQGKLEDKSIVSKGMDLLKGFL